MVENRCWNQVLDMYNEFPAPSFSPPEIIIFSKDRPIQLYALLESLKLNLKGYGKIHVLYSACDDEFEKGYNNIFETFGSEVNGYRETKSFRDELIALLNKITSKYMFFLVDDIFFIQPTDLSLLKDFDLKKNLFSLRMGRNITKNYGKEDILPQPELTTPKNGFISWDWKGGKKGWGYPTSVDGHIFITEEIVKLTNASSFHSPNTYEPALRDFQFIYYKRKGLAFEKASIVNVPCNKVQIDNNNKHGDIDHITLLKKWNEGYIIDIKQLQNFENCSTHQDLSFSYIKRNQY